MKVRLEADFDDFEQVVFYRRGVHTRQEEVKHLFGLRRRTIEFTNYAKVLVHVQFKDAAYFEAKGKDVDSLPFAPGSTIIKLFQVPGRTPRRPGNAVSQCASADAPRRQAADRRSRGRLRPRSSVLIRSKFASSARALSSSTRRCCAACRSAGSNSTIVRVSVSGLNG